MSDTANIAAALAKFQAEMPTVAKAHKADVPTKTGGKYSYTYASLADVTDAAMPLLSKHGLSFTSLPRYGERGFELSGTLLHESGESLHGELPIHGNTPQEIGSSLTYMRRYLLGCMTGIVTDDDDDGRAAQPAKRAKAVKPLTTTTRARMFALFGEHHISDEDEQRRGIAHIIGRDIASRGELNEDEAQKVIAVLAAKPKPAAVTS